MLSHTTIIKLLTWHVSIPHLSAVTVLWPRVDKSDHDCKTARFTSSRLLQSCSPFGVAQQFTGRVKMLINYAYWNWKNGHVFHGGKAIDLICDGAVCATGKFPMQRKVDTGAYAARRVGKQLDATASPCVALMSRVRQQQPSHTKQLLGWWLHVVI